MNANELRVYLVFTQLMFFVSPARLSAMGVNNSPGLFTEMFCRYYTFYSTQSLFHARFYIGIEQVVNGHLIP